MSEEIIHLHVRAPAKPPEGAPCNGCGVCCALELCPVGRVRFLRRDGICPALSWSEGENRYRCGLLAEPVRWLPGWPAFAEPQARRLMARWISAGSGCDCDAEALG